MEVKTFFRSKHLLAFLAFMVSGYFAFSQDFNITGKVSNSANNTPLSGVTVRVKEKQTATTTKEDGTFTITAPKGSTLVFTYVGYVLREVAVTNNANVNVQLSTSTGGLDEVVVVGYGTKRKRDITSAISTVNMSDIGEAPSRGVTQLLQGQAPGVVVKQKDGKPGAEFEVRVRGISSLGAGSEPLYVIDGLAMGTSSGVNINPNDIES
ncbi:MAG TPA: carboxypeptidase-like regulatory domain-containing protein, partial [Segetibacter sp.]|nr:carboxypeptidase-like regulatory domain-containing protein [Segetibacter sp.]